jgi:hypothetical protein
LNGDVRESLRLNAAAVPISLLFAASLLWPTLQWLRGRPAQLSNRWLYAWGALLLTAWILKLCSDPDTW